MVNVRRHVWNMTHAFLGLDQFCGFWRNYKTIHVSRSGTSIAKRVTNIWICGPYHSSANNVLLPFSVSTFLGESARAVEPERIDAASGLCPSLRLQNPCKSRVRVRVAGWRGVFLSCYQSHQSLLPPDPSACQFMTVLGK